MTSSEDFKQAIRAGNINEAFLVAMSNAPELNITTKIITADGQQRKVNQAEMDNYLHTHINLIEGKVENEIGEKLTGDRYSEIKQFHLQQVTKGHQTIQHNLISLQKMFQLMSSFYEQQTSNHNNWVDIAANVTQEPISSKSDTGKLNGNKIPNALKAGEINSKIATLSPDEIAEENYEPLLPSFDEEDESVVDDLLSLTDIDNDSDEPENPENQSDWSEWLEEEPDVKPEVFDLKSLNIRDAAKNWQDWEFENESVKDSINQTQTDVAD
jgi:hypothetical protein